MVDLEHTQTHTFFLGKLAGMFSIYGKVHKCGATAIRLQDDKCITQRALNCLKS